MTTLKIERADAIETLVNYLRDHLAFHPKCYHLLPQEPQIPRHSCHTKRVSNDPDNAQ